MTRIFCAVPRFALVVGFAVSTHAAVIEVKPCVGNATPAVAAALARLRDGDTLRFADGEYHFYVKGAKNEFLASVGSSTGMKKVVFYLEGLKDVTIDGGGSRFFFHGNTFPFAAARPVLRRREGRLRPRDTVRLDRLRRGEHISCADDLDTRQPLPRLHAFEAICVRRHPIREQPARKRAERHRGGRPHGLLGRVWSCPQPDGAQQRLRKHETHVLRLPCAVYWAGGT